ncbi:anthranilate synthase component I family protein [Rhodopirellula sp. MGV]|uniref:anthranilate synthase component I family protein n=1 Tax=Rhodopirellula sp. MGV TaxID=2023130 RepID=UPI000B977845|nr:anthranilate synthase component I family protein [Rhodopirellula sp. MGV]OYP38888.1 hypothetical protein CGZ80_01325 [Rhodopirellula sp. MGV]PNY38299.1 anthranilate synthase component I family protein [Rhodopirellula baltica]
MPSVTQLVTSLDKPLDPVAIFQRLAPLGRRVWLDSSAGEPETEKADKQATEVGLNLNPHARYSFLTADPILELVAHVDDPDPWPALSQLAARLPDSRLTPRCLVEADGSCSGEDSLPPFQGGLVGIIGYEASRWIEPQELATCHLNQQDDLPTPAMSFGVFDWTIAIDHFTHRAWLICQGWDRDMFAGDLADAPPTLSTEQLAQNASERRDQILALLNDEWCEAATPDSQANETGETYTVPITSNFAEGEFCEAVEQIVAGIRNGDSFQVNLAQRLTAPENVLPEQLYLSLRQANPAPQSGFYDGGSFHVLSSSPEGFLQIRDSHVSTRPIKGTRPRTGDEAVDRRYGEELLASEKDRAENIMIVDLMRNDLSQVCTDESVRVSQLCQLERYECVQHLVSVVEGDLRPESSIVDCLRACFPGGSITGAPKIEAMKIIARLEPNPRGPYCGSMGYISCSGQADFNILIRTITATGGQLQIPVGGGITARSEPAAEEAETWAKAEGMLRSLGPYSIIKRQLSESGGA